MGYEIQLAKEQSHYSNWEKGFKNWADYFTKHHPPAHHKKTRPHYILDR